MYCKEHCQARNGHVLKATAPAQGGRDKKMHTNGVGQKNRITPAVGMG
jgi:hypothetical protein